MGIEPDSKDAIRGDHPWEVPWRCWLLSEVAPVPRVLFLVFSVRPDREVVGQWAAKCAWGI